MYPLLQVVLLVDLLSGGPGVTHTKGIWKDIVKNQKVRLMICIRPYLRTCLIVQGY